MNQHIRLFLVAHIKIDQVDDNQIIPSFSLPEIRYTVTYKDIFKVFFIICFLIILTYLQIPDSFVNTTAIPSVIYTPNQSSLCGIVLKVNKEYLLTGFF